MIVPLLNPLLKTHPAPTPPLTSPQRLSVLKTKGMSTEAAWLSSGRPSRMLVCPSTPLRPHRPEELLTPTEAEHLLSTGTEWERILHWATWISCMATPRTEWDAWLRHLVLHSRTREAARLQDNLSLDKLWLKSGSYDGDCSAILA